MKAALFAVGSLLCLFLAMFSALKMLAYKATWLFEGIAPASSTTLLLQLTSAGSFVLSAVLFLLTWKNLGSALETP